MMRAFLKLMFLTIALVLPAAAIADADKDREDARIARAHRLEREGDDLATAGQLDQAVEHYQHALSLGALYAAAYYNAHGGNGTNAITPQGWIVYPLPGQGAYIA